MIWFFLLPLIKNLNKKTKGKKVLSQNLKKDFEPLFIISEKSSEKSVTERDQDTIIEEEILHPINQTHHFLRIDVDVLKARGKVFRKSF